MSLIMHHEQRHDKDAVNTAFCSLVASFAFSASQAWHEAMHTH